MDKILSKDEMNALLNSPAGSGDTAGTDKAATDAGRITLYNFRRPDRFSKSTLHSLQLLHDRFSTSVAASLSAYFRTLTEVSVLSIEQANFSDFLNSLPDPSCLSALSMRPLQGMAVLEIGPDVAFPLIDRLLGGAGGTENSERKMTEIEKNIFRGVINLMTGDLDAAWKPVSEVSFHLHSSETRPQLLQVAPPNEVVIVVALELKMSETRGAMHLCFPFSALEPILGAFEQGNVAEQKPEAVAGLAADLPKVLRCVLRAPIRVRCELPATMVTVNDLVNIAKGDVLTLDSGINDRVRVRVGGGPAFDASLVEVDGRKGAEIISRIAN